MVIADNDFAHDNFIIRTHDDPNFPAGLDYDIPRAVDTYQSSYHYCDRKNQHLGYETMDHKNQRKDQTLLFKIIENLAIDNAWII